MAQVVLSIPHPVRRLSCLMATSVCLGVMVLGTTGCSASWDRFGVGPRARFWEKYTAEGESWLQKQKYSQAIASFRVALTEARYFGHDDLRLGFALDNLGHALIQDGQNEEAQKYFVEALEVYKTSERERGSTIRQALREDGVARCYAGLGQIHLQKKEFTEARDAFTSALNACGSSGIKNPLLGQNVATTLNGLASSYLCLGDYNLAEDSYKRALAAAAGSIGTDRIKREILLGYAKLLKLTGRSHKAPGIFKSLPQSSGDEEWLSLKTRGHTAFAHDDFRQAEELYKRALAKAQMISPQSEEAASTYKDLARLYLAEKKSSQAVSAINEALAIKRQSLGPEDSDTIRLLSQAIAALIQMEEYKQALALIDQHYRLEVKLFSEDSQGAMENRAWFAYALHKLGEENECSRALDELLPRLHLKNHRMKFASTLSTVAHIYEDRKEYDKAESLFVQSLDVRQKGHHMSSVKVTDTVKDLAILHKKMGKWAIAASEFKEALAALENVPDRDEKALKDIYREIIDCDTHDGNFSEAEMYRKKL